MLLVITIFPIAAPKTSSQGSVDIPMSAAKN